MFEDNWIKLSIFLADKVLHLRSNLSTTSQRLTKQGTSGKTVFVRGGGILPTLAYFEETHLMAASSRLFGHYMKISRRLSFSTTFIYRA